MRRLLLALTLSGCGSGPPVDAATPPPKPVAQLQVLGIAQDAGVPQLGCSCVRCQAARKDPVDAFRVASTALTLADGRVFLIDATEDVEAQVSDLRVSPPGERSRRPVEGILLTHAHMGHYIGLAQFGFESAHADALDVYATPSMAEFLRENGPWRSLVERKEINLVEITPGEPFELGPVSITPIAVPHRREYSDTVAFRFQGPSETILYLPDTDPWAKWDDFSAIWNGVDVAIVDGTFFSADELPGRDMSKVAHPTITDTMNRLEGATASGELDVYFTHLNHTNPALQANSTARAEIKRRGFAVATRGQDFGL